MSEPKRLSKISIEDYLALEDCAADSRHEFVNGQIFAMTGGTSGHNVISLNIAATLRSRLKDSGCTVYMADMKVRVDEINCFYYPDILVDCGAFDKASTYTKKPVIIFEVLSRSTAMIDRREKLVAYRSLESLCHYVIVHQARKRVDIYQKVDSDTWLEQEIGNDETLLLDCCLGHPIEISVDEIYSGIEFEEGPDLQVREEAEIYSW